MFELHCHQLKAKLHSCIVAASEFGIVSYGNRSNSPLWIDSVADMLACFSKKSRMLSCKYMQSRSVFHDLNLTSCPSKTPQPNKRTKPALIDLWQYIVNQSQEYLRMNILCSPSRHNMLFWHDKILGWTLENQGSTLGMYDQHTVNTRNTSKIKLL